MIKGKKYIQKQSKKYTQSQTSKRIDIVRIGGENHIILNIEKTNINGIKRCLINPIKRNSDFILKAQKLCAHKSVESSIHSKENLPKIHFSREIYRKVWTNVIQDYNNQENK